MIVRNPNYVEIKKNCEIKSDNIVKEQTASGFVIYTTSTLLGFPLLRL